MKAFTKFALLLILSFQIISCDNDKIPSPSIEIMEDKIVCEKCDYFGSIIEADDDDLVVADAYHTIFIFERKNQELKLIKTIGFEVRSGIRSVLLKDGLLIFAHPDEDGTGIVYIYEKRLNDWEKIQELTIGRNQDDFGSSIDISDDFLVIGASAPYANKDEGRIYIYKKTSSGFVLDSEFKSQNSHGGDGFGASITIQDNIVLAGGGVPIHIYHYDGEWNFLRTEPLHTSKIVHHENNFVAKNSGGYDEMLYAFILNENGTYEPSNISFDFSNQELSGHGEILEIYGTTLLFALEMGNYCYTMEYLNNEWTNITKIEPQDNQSQAMIGLELTEDKIYVGGDFDNYVYIIDY